MKLKRTLTAAVVLLIVGAVTLTGCGKDNEIVIGSKDFGENVVLGEMFAQLIETNTDLKVNRKLNMGGTFVCFEAIKNGDIDIYPEYTGTGLTAQLKMDVITDSDEAYRVVSEEFGKQFDIKWLKPLGFNNTYTLAVTNEVYEQYGVETYSDLAKVSENLIFGAEHEFFDRQDGYDGLVALYGIKFKSDPKKMNVSLKYQAIGKGDMDVTDAFSTDGPIKQYNLKVLEDDKNFFPPYYAAPIVRNETLEKHPELEDVLNQLAGLIDDSTMTDLNYKIDVEGKSIEAVAKEFLNAKGLI
ncbi:glycine betaine ABC transporter substrate-binding protein [Sinanaerobacter chloroacetimidivorans]|uniref:Glycine/betaine ABC transporter substrate-binding protein n=1 Tax=Sinanaerobacter chloroacetimidivorans TaxID=2818044 RepID=A0A8J8B0U5_9FIRM|nr:glycine betaine ABC transporter substrate-binding protein [Sinanaerobacter chloroacetimidivorans]MBR0597998.1 glycine/betaine ABC transporter substrate-binding protein [Sinanaerobacter chloroacetimidivorans]